MAKYVTKKEIVDAILAENRDLSPTFPLLAFDNDVQDIKCKNCGSVNNAKAFRYNASCAAGYDSVVFKWEVDLTRVMARGDVCYNCNRHNIIFEYPKIEGSHRENDPKKINNVELGGHENISSYSGDEI